MKKVRLDVLLHERGLSGSREKARKEIIAGWVKVEGETVRVPSKKVEENKNITVERPGGRFVSRGGEKLARAIQFFGLDIRGMTVLDLGASTGGFTDCMLQSGAAKVYALDVGHNQLDYSLRIDERVVVMEKTHARDINSDMFAENISFFTADLSFISILKVLPAVAEVFSTITGVVLIKPQFEAEPGEQKKGVVRDSDSHVNILTRVIAGIGESGFSVKGLVHSPVKGPAGNIEFLALVERGGKELPSCTAEIEKIVSDAHDDLD